MSVPASDCGWSFLLAAGSAGPGTRDLDHIRSVLTEEIDWPAFLRLADHHGMSSLLHQSLLRIGNTVPANVLQSLRQRHETNIHKCLFLTRELIRILDSLRSRAIEVLPYKGVVLSETMYSDIALRQPGDIDLLVRASDLPCIKSAVRELGYTPHMTLSTAQERAYIASGYECTFDHPAGRNLLELQWALQPSFYSVDFDVGSVFRRAVTVDVAGRRMRTPSPEDLLLVLSVHAAKHVWGRLIWLCDIAQIMALQDLDWNWIESQAKALGIERILRVTLLLAKRMLGAALSTSLHGKLKDDRAAQVLCDEIEAGMARDVASDVESISYFRLMMRLRERRSDRVRFLRRLIFTPGPGEWEMIQLPAPLFPLYRVVRLGRLAARLIRG